MTDPGTTLGDAVHQRTAELTPAERRVARTLFASNLMAGFDTVAGLAARTGVSGPTVLRFAGKIGFAGYAEFQRALECDVAARIDSPLRLYDRSPPERRISTLEYLRKGYTWDEQEFPQHPEERGP